MPPAHTWFGRSIETPRERQGNTLCPGADLLVRGFGPRGRNAHQPHQPLHAPAAHLQLECDSPRAVAVRVKRIDPALHRRVYRPPAPADDRRPNAPDPAAHTAAAPIASCASCRAGLAIRGAHLPDLPAKKLVHDLIGDPAPELPGPRVKP